MRRSKKRQKRARNVTLPGWLKLRADETFVAQMHWMIDGAEECNAGSVKLRVKLKRKPWVATLEVKRYDG